MERDYEVERRRFPSQSEDVCKERRLNGSKKASGNERAPDPNGADVVGWK